MCVCVCVCMCMCVRACVGACVDYGHIYMDVCDVNTSGPMPNYSLCFLGKDLKQRGPERDPHLIIKRHPLVAFRYLSA